MSISSNAVKLYFCETSVLECMQTMLMHRSYEAEWRPV